MPTALDLHRRITEAVRHEAGLAYLPCCLLALLVSHGGSMLVREFPRALIGNENTVVVAAIKLERAGLIEKTSHPDDRRISVFHATRQGIESVKRAFDGIERAMGEALSEAAEPRCARVCTAGAEDCVRETMRTFLAAAPGFCIPAIEANALVHDRIPPAFPLVVSALIRLWSQTVIEHGNLTLTGYRCLVALRDEGRSLPCCALADSLAVDRSTISTVIKPLHRADLVEFSRGADKRQRVVSITAQGIANAREAAAELDRATAPLFAGRVL
ncbi:winged helix DNA-binding protein [Raoultibacter phocaeensis]|uniref:winged helix DNA-binding protein n=1 Tax=Raoultibacter phocaeensis TaxID=2479841 RepID=UPI00111B4CA6|nr:winged helix DNA-binding protein [Raoultibacter phocaeensis]